MQGNSFHAVLCPLAGRRGQGRSISSHGSELLLHFPADGESVLQMQAREEHQQRLQQQVEEKQQACKILAMQLQDAHRKNAGAHHDNANLPQPDERPRQVRATTPAVDRPSEGGYPE